MYFGGLVTRLYWKRKSKGIVPFWVIMNNHTIFHYILTVLWVCFKGILDSLLWVVVGAVGFYLFYFSYSPYNIAIGLPLLIIGIGVLINSLGSDVLSVFSPQFNKGVCPLCRD